MLQEKIKQAIAIQKDLDGYYKTNIDRHRAFSSAIMNAMKTLGFSKQGFEVKNLGKFTISQEAVEIPVAPKDFSEKVQEQLTKPVETLLQEYINTCQNIMK